MAKIWINIEDDSDIIGMIVDEKIEKMDLIENVEKME